jgi:hypothetical protein
MVCPVLGPSAFASTASLSWPSFRIEPVFEELRRSLDELLQRATKPEDRRSVLARMKSTLVQAQIGVDDLRNALQFAQKKLAAEQQELATVRRRKELAAGINDAETLAVAEKFEKQHAERVAVLEAKVAAQTQEVDLAERELSEMKQELKTASIGAPPGPSAQQEAERELDEALGDSAAAQTSAEIDALARQRKRADIDAEAQRKLDEMKKNMGK